MLPLEYQASSFIDDGECREVGGCRRQDKLSLHVLYMGIYDMGTEFQRAVYGNLNVKT